MEPQMSAVKADIDKDCSLDNARQCASARTVPLEYPSSIESAIYKAFLFEAPWHVGRLTDQPIVAGTADITHILGESRDQGEAMDCSNVTFRTVRFKEGYAVDEVDDFLDRISKGAVTAEQVRNKTFTTVRFKEGYDVDEVDDFLDKVYAQLGGEVPVEAAAQEAQEVQRNSSDDSRVSAPIFFH